MKEKALVIGDTHFEDGPPGYLSSQIKCLESIISKKDPGVVIFLGDIFHHRKPTPSCITEVCLFLERIRTAPRKSSLDRVIFVIRGNHDSMSKSDDDNTILSIFNLFKIAVFKSNFFQTFMNFCALPHYENEEITKNYLKEVKLNRDTLVLGHVGFEGCVNVDNEYTFTIDKSLFKNRTILGHIHRYAEHGNITIMGTPWSTSFGESGYPHFVGTLDIDYSGKHVTYGKLDLVEVTGGPKHMVLPYEALETYEDELKSKGHFILLRVLLDKFSEDTIIDLKSKIMEKYGIPYVDFRFQPIYDKKLNNRLSDYDPQKALSSINNNIIDKYLEEQKSSIPTEVLKMGLEEIKKHADTESQD